MIFNGKEVFLCVGVKMNRFWPLVVLLASLTAVKSGLQFYDCGSNLLVNDIFVSGCTENPCIIPRGSQVEVSLAVDQVPQLDTMDVEAAVYIYGNKFLIGSILRNPCVSGCPLREVISGASFNVTITIPSNLISRPAELVINATYVSNGNEMLALCVGFDVDITRT